MSTLTHYVDRGPHPVGVTTLELQDPQDASRTLPTDVWYPADPAAFDAQPPANHPLGADHLARTDAPKAKLPGACPLIAFSHGNSGFRQQSTFLTTHLASWGMVVTAPDHSGNTFMEMMKVESEDERIRIHKDARRNRPSDLGAAIEAVAAGGLWPTVALSRLAVLGHSYGGWTALKMPARDSRVRAVCALAPATEPFVGKKAFDPGELPLPCPSLVLAALDDVLVDIDTSIHPLFGRLERSALVGIRGADHFHFCDLLALIHGMHEKNGPRPKQTRATRPYAELLEEERTHRLVRAIVTTFLTSTLSDELASEKLSPQSLQALDPALLRLDPGSQ